MTNFSHTDNMNSVHFMTTSRRERLKSELREEILAAARELFLVEGFPSVSIRKIADKVGCAPGTIYLHFADKESILEAICVETFAILDKRMRAIAEDAGDPLENLRRGGRAYVQFGVDHPHHYMVTFGVAGMQFQPESEVHRAGMQSFDRLRTCVRKCVEAGQLRSNDVEEVAQTLWACTHGLVLLLIAKEGFPFIEPNRLLDSLLDMCIEGIRKR